MQRVLGPAWLPRLKRSRIKHVLRVGTGVAKILVVSPIHRNKKNEIHSSRLTPLAISFWILLSLPPSPPGALLPADIHSRRLMR